MALGYGKMHSTYERWSLLFYQIFEISLRLVRLFIFLKLLSFSDATFPLDFSVRVSELHVLPFFLVSYTIVTGFLYCLSFFCKHMHLLSVLGISGFF